MSGSAKVFNVDAIYNAMQETYKIRENTFELCAKGISLAMKTVEITEEEERISLSMLNIAKEEEAYRLAIVTQLEAELAEAACELAAASCDPPVAAMIAEKIARIEAELAEAIEEYNRAVEHRQRLEYRYELAQRALSIAQERLESLQMQYENLKRDIEEIVDRECFRLKLAYEDLTTYIARLAPDVRESSNEWFNEKPEKDKPVKPDMIRDRLNVNEGIINSILEYLYATDSGFRENIQNYCAEIKSGNEPGAELKIRKQMVGRVCEEVVINAFKPISTNISTQSKESLPDGRYTKVDMIVYGLTNPIILGRGEGMGAREGGTLAVEVKSGQSSYLFQQLEHMQDQAFGHQKCDASCVICTRDIHDLSPEKENELREKLREAGSPIIGMLPRKEELDSICIKFVKEKLNNV